MVIFLSFCPSFNHSFVPHFIDSFLHVLRFLHSCRPVITPPWALPVFTPNFPSPISFSVRVYNVTGNLRF